LNRLGDGPPAKEGKSSGGVSLQKKKEKRKKRKKKKEESYFKRTKFIYYLTLSVFRLQKVYLNRINRKTLHVNRHSLRQAHY
jgi:hypothetical protein